MPEQQVTYDFNLPPSSHVALARSSLSGDGGSVLSPSVHCIGGFSFSDKRDSFNGSPSWVRSQHSENELGTARSSGIQKSATCPTLRHHKVPATFTYPNERRQGEDSSATSGFAPPCSIQSGLAPIVVMNVRVHFSNGAR